MSWFKFLKNTFDIYAATPTIEYIKAPVRRRVVIDDLKEDIDSGEIIYVDLGSKSINKYYDNSLSEQFSHDSYIVVYEDSVYEKYGIAVKSKVVDNIIYFQAAEQHLKNVKTSKYYSIYYGLKNIKYLQQLDTTYLKQFETLQEGIELKAYRQVDDVENVEFTQGAYLDLDIANLQDYTYEATETSSKNFKLSLNNNGIDWKDNVSTKIGAKAMGIFDGPGFEIHGSKGSNYGKFRIRILSLDEDNNISKNISLDWTEVDCYNSSLNDAAILFSKSDLEYNRYIFEIETIADKNTMSKSNQVKIDKYMFSPNYKLTYEKEEFNPDLSFIRIGGIR